MHRTLNRQAMRDMKFHFPDEIGIGGTSALLAVREKYWKKRRPKFPLQMHKYTQKVVEDG
ncbi:hypothetical protein LOAG_06864 [Loa loa]|uniref:Uncharacterized protein n=1 Tax=Loa loa TaxID=7209 RepID=A0A1S0TXJ6_LOALO|nr:hypothetical protein LOAG_06864 [Loa loa]EFO21622.1 hypothetical protein LOAG_06864 [Loa loa]